MLMLDNLLLMLERSTEDPLLRSTFYSFLNPVIKLSSLRKGFFSRSLLADFVDETPDP
jgi:hypothetical protein